MRVNMRNITAGEQEGHARHPVEALHRCRKLLTEQHDRRDNLGRRLIKMGKVLFAYDLRMSRPDRLAIEESKQASVFMHDMGRPTAMRDLANPATIGHDSAYTAAGHLD
jgi:hypothetical protein